MSTACLTVGGIAISLLYSTAFEEERARLVEIAQSQARLVEAVARFDAIYSKDYPEGSEKATLSQMVDAHKHYKGFGKTGEFTLAKHEGDSMVFLLSHRHFDLQNPKPVLFRSRLAEPMRLALSGLSGTVIGPDYRGEKVLAAHEPVQELDLGIVAKIDLAEVREPFVRAGAVAVGMAILVVLAGAGLFIRISSPMIKDLEERSASLATANEELKREIAERKLAERALQDSEDLLKKTQEIAHVGSWSLDLKKKELYWSDEVYRIFGLKPQEFGATYEAFLKSVHFEDREMVDKAYNEAVQNHTPYEITHRVLRPDGEVRVVHEKSVDMVDESGETIRSIGMVHDITERKEAEQELKKTHEELKGFVDIVTHDLKNPILAIQGFSELFIKTHKESLGKKGKGYIEHIQASARQMSRLISDLLSLSRIGRMVPDFKHIPAHEIVKTVSKRLRHMIEDNGIELVVVDDLPTVYCHDKTIYQVFENLLSNAVKYTKNVENPRIEIGCEDSEEEHQFYVRDNGGGIDPIHHRSIFDMFSRLRDAEQEEGTGLGLAIVKKIVTKHGGKVWVESEKDQGAVFYFALPKGP
jgi:PAS domain S-box-containing protein